MSWVNHLRNELMCPTIGVHFCHPQGTFELFHVESGILTLNIDGKAIELHEGQSAIAKTDVPHSYSNQADSDLVFTMSVAELHR